MPNGAAQAQGVRSGFVKIIADQRYGEILGAHIVGPNATELLPELSLAQMMEFTPSEIAHNIHAPPTLAEVVMEAAHGVEGQPFICKGQCVTDPINTRRLRRTRIENAPRWQRSANSTVSPSSTVSAASPGRRWHGWTIRRPSLPPGPSDVDLGAKPLTSADLNWKTEVALAQALEDLLGVNRVDLVNLDNASPFLAAEAVHGERLYAENQYAADNYDLYILRQEGDLAF